MSLFKKAMAALGVLGVASGLALAGASPAVAQEETPTKRVYNGMQIIANDRQHEGLEKPFQDYFCTIGAVGDDKYGNKIAISAGHCWGMADNPYSGQVIPEELGMPLYDRSQLDWKPGGNDLGHDPIGWVRFFVGNPCSTCAGDPGRDYSVIVLDPDVTLSSQGPYIKMTGNNELPNGSINSPFVKNRVALPEEKVVGSGLFSNNILITAGQNPNDSYGKATFYGRITNNQAAGTVGVYQSGAAHLPGDSGGPAILKPSGAPNPGTGGNFNSEGPWVGIVRGTVLSYPTWSYTSSANILADLRTRDIASGEDGSVVGAGFQVTLNP